MPPSEARKDRSDSDRKYQEIPSHCRKFTPPGAFEGGRQISDRRPRGVNYATYGMATSNLAGLNNSEILF